MQQKDVTGKNKNNIVKRNNDRLMTNDGGRRKMSRNEMQCQETDDEEPVEKHIRRRPRL